MDTINFLIENKIHSYEESLLSLLKEAVDAEMPSVFEAAILRVNRVRNGKVQRNRRVSGDKNYTFRGGSLHRISPVEHRRRQLSQRLAARKRKSKMGIALRRRKLSLLRRKALGGNSLR